MTLQTNFLDPTSETELYQQKNPVRCARVREDMDTYVQEHARRDLSTFRAHSSSSSSLTTIALRRELRVCMRVCVWQWQGAM